MASCRVTHSVSPEVADILRQCVALPLPECTLWAIERQPGTLDVNRSKPIPSNGFCKSAYLVTSKSGFLQEAKLS
jgi:hypothetical protein